MNNSAYFEIAEARSVVRCAGLVVATLVLSSASGCGSDKSTAEVTGRVTFEGTPATTGTITFYPAKGRASVGSIHEDGSYELFNGALVGDHTVTIEAFESTGTQPLPISFEDELKNPRALTSGGQAPNIVWLVPEEFASQTETTLTAKVEPGKTNEINFDL